MRGIETAGPVPKKRMSLYLSRHAGSGVAGDRTFFKNHVGQMIETAPASERIAVILEDHPHTWGHLSAFVGTTRLKKYENDPGKLEALLHEKRLEIKVMDAKLRKAVDETIHLGTDLNSTLVTWGTWGFEAEILEKNRRHPNSVQVYWEPETITADMVNADRIIEKSTSENVSLESALEYVKAMITFICERDRTTAKFAMRVSERVDTVIIVRGTDHRGIRALFDPEQYDVTCACADVPVSDFATEAASKSYNAPLTPEELSRYARLQVSLWKYEREHPIPEPLECTGMSDTGITMVVGTWITAAKQWAQKQIGVF